jgi:hypothetical protein
VSTPQLPCLPTQVSIEEPGGRWICAPTETPCPDGTTLYVSVPEPYVWRACATPESVAALTAAHGPNQAVATVPALSTWATIVVVLVIALVGLRWLR